MDFDAAKKARDKRLRKRLLWVLDLAKNTPTGGLGGQSLADEVDDFFESSQRFEGESHAIRLIRDLRGKGLLDEKQFSRRRTESFGLRHMALTITAKGTGLLLESVPPDPDIDDERIVAEEM